MKQVKLVIRDYSSNEVYFSEDSWIIPAIGDTVIFKLGKYNEEFKVKDRWFYLGSDVVTLLVKHIK